MGSRRSWRHPQRYGAFTFLGFAADADGVLLVDEVLRMEDMEEGLAPLLGRLGIAVPERLPHIGRGRYREDYRPYYDEEARDLIAALYADDVKRFDYSF